MMYRFLLFAAATIPLIAAERKLTWDERVELIRGLSSEYATAKIGLPKSKKALPYDAVAGQQDKEKWDDAGREFGPAARAGDTVQVTKVELEDDKILLELNGGFTSGKKWYQRIEVGAGNNTRPIGQSGQPTAGTYIALLFPKGVPAVPAADIKKMLAPILDFEKRTATENYIDTLPAPIKQAIIEKRPLEGMTREQMILAIGKPRTKTRETKDDVELEDWIYGQPPGKITFVTFDGDKCIKVKDTYAGLGGSVAPPLPTK